MARFVVVQKPVQDIITIVLFVTIILVVVMAGVMTVPVLERAGILQTGITLTGVDTGSLGSPTNSVPADEPAGYDDCDVVYYQATPPLDEYAITASETEDNDLAAMYYAVYICTGASASAGNYI